MTKPMNEPMTKPITEQSLRKRRRRSCFTVAACVAVLAIAAAIGIAQARPLTTSSLQIINTCTNWAWPQPKTKPQTKPWEWRTGRVSKRSSWDRARVGDPADTIIQVIPEYPYSVDVSYGGLYQPTGSIVQHPQTYHTGFLTPWLRYRSHTVDVFPEPNIQPPITLQEQFHVREKLVDWYTFEQKRSYERSTRFFTEIDHDPIWLDRLRQGDGTMWSIRPLLLIIDLIALAAMITAIVSITKIVRTTVFLRRLNNHNKCPKCHYNLAGIEHQATNCPECGQSLKLKPNTNTSPSEQP